MERVTREEMKIEYGEVSWTPEMRQVAKVEPCP